MTRSTPRRTQWPTQVDTFPGTPINTCPACGAHSSGSHICRSTTTPTTQEQQ
jgi:hypothetical protein